jgi:hypothetical protein
MTTLVVLFNLKDSAAVAKYEAWARAVDLPTAGSLKSVEQFEVLRTQGLLGGGAAPYQYVEILRINDMRQFGSDIATPEMQKVASQFQAFASNPLFLLTEPL